MRLDLYQAETARIAAEQMALLNQAREVLAQGRPLTKLEQSGLLHALQILIKNSIGKTKQILKVRNIPVPVSAYDAFAALVGQGEIETTQLQAWNAVIGLRNRIVHDYMNIDMNRVLELVQTNQDKLIVEFLLKPISEM